MHSHKKRKDNLEGSLVRVLFAAELEFSKILQSWPRYMRQTLVLVEIARYGKSLISIFEQFFACIDKIVILGRRLGTRL